MLTTIGGALYKRGSLYGASLVASEFEEPNILIWGPRGCSSQVVEATNNQRHLYDMYHFRVTQADMMMNGMATVTPQLLSMVRGCNVPGPLFFFLGDATALISEDLESLIESRISPDFPIIYVETGFKGDYRYGINETVFRLVQRLCRKKTERDPKRLNLIPEVGINPQWRADAAEVARILGKFGYTVSIAPCRSQLSDIADMTRASRTLLMNPDVGKKAAQYLSDTHDIPFFVPKKLPIGVWGTKLWLDEVAGFLGIGAEAVSKVHYEEEAEFFFIVRPGLREERYHVRANTIRESAFVVCDDRHRASQWARTMMEELQFKRGWIFPTWVGEAAPEEVRGVEVLPEGDLPSLTAHCSRPEVRVLLGADWVDELLEGRTKCKAIPIANPMSRRISLGARPYFGYRGMLNVVEDALNSVVC
ncbi:MAG: hypothetical protein HYZ28_02240 [Myxococcales bacterium]|nr:hypothetical protein [Myxococcales bacterium]